MHRVTPQRHVIVGNKGRPPDLEGLEAAYMRDKIAGIYRILKYSPWDSARERLRELPLKWDSYTVNQVLKSHPPLEKAWLFFNWASELSGFKHDQYTYTTMLDIFGEAGRIPAMVGLFKRMQNMGLKADVVTFTSMMHWLSCSGDIDGAVRIWDEMKGNGFRPTVVSYTAYMKIMLDNGRLKEAAGAYEEMLRFGLSPTCHTYTILMEFMVASGRCVEALDMFAKMQEAGVLPDKATCNILVDQCCKVKDAVTIMKILPFMKENNLVLRYSVFLEAQKMLTEAGKSDDLLRQIHPHLLAKSGSKGELVRHPVTSLDVSCTEDGLLILLLLKKQNHIALEHLLGLLGDEGRQLDSVTFSTLIEIACNEYNVNRALLVLSCSKKWGLKIDKQAYLSLIGSLIRLKEFEKVADVMEDMIEAGISLGSYLVSLIILRLGRARRPTAAKRIFRLLPDSLQNVSSYSALVNAHVNAGTADKALEVLESMRRRGICPASGTYDMLLNGLEKFGRLLEISMIRKEMKSRSSGNSQKDAVNPADESICNLLFARDVP
ncbi:hypothetical protein MLD38_005383 [Melastoma candidum]|uniref:Uncharacterized protein n=1 Tax=Melastoma candidum TaxID=119954 RepID=A0ACB9SBX9_9MYRT|nr:hypothetical protein MLD38_005383 [Melastoma candidum]